MVCTSYRPDNIYVFDVNSGEEIESVEYDIQSNINPGFSETHDEDKLEH